MEGVKGRFNVFFGMILILWISLLAAVSPALLFADDMHEAVSDLDFDSVKKMLKEDETVVNRRDKKGRTPLVIACENNNTDMARLLLDAGADPGIQTLELSTALHEAAKGGNTELIRLLLSRDADTYAEDNRNQKKPIHYAVKNGHLEAVKLFLEDETMIEADNEHSWTPLMYAAYEGHTDLVKYLLSKKAKLNARTFDGMTALHLAADKGHLDVVKLLIEKGAKPDTINARKNTPLHFACMRAHPEVAAFLLEKGANPNAADLNGSTALHAVAEGGSVETLKVLLKYKPEINSKRYMGMTPLLIASGKGYGEMVSLLLEHKADVKAQNWYRYTALHFACQSKSHEIVELLLNHNVDFSAQNLWKYTALHFACQAGHLKTAELLIENGLDVNHRTRDSQYPVLLAAQNGHTDVVKLLIEKGANVNVTNKLKMTPLHLASMYFHKETAKLLIEKGADVNAVSKFGHKPPDISQDYMEIIEMNPKSPAELLVGEKLKAKIHYGSGSTERVKVWFQPKNVTRLPVHFYCSPAHFKKVDKGDTVIQTLTTDTPFRLRSIHAKMFFESSRKEILLEKDVDVTWKEKYPYISECLFMQPYKVRIFLDEYNAKTIFDILAQKGIKNLEMGVDEDKTEVGNKITPITISFTRDIPVEVAQFIINVCSRIYPIKGVRISGAPSGGSNYNYHIININTDMNGKKTISKEKLIKVLDPALTQSEFHELLNFHPTLKTFGRKGVELYFIEINERELVKNAEKNFVLQNYKEAIIYYKKCLTKVEEGKSDIIKYLKERLAISEFHMDFNKGKWVSMIPPGNFSGWERKNGKWTVEKDGTLKGVSDGKGFGLFLLHKAQVLDDYEITGQFDGYKEHGGVILNQIPERGGYVIKNKLLEVPKFICVHFAPKYNAVQLRKDNEKRGMKQIKMPLSDLTHFRIQVWNGTITVFVNGKPAFVNEYFPPGDWGVNEGRIGVGSSYHRHPGYVNKFQNLMIRKLTRRPLDPEEMFKHEEEGKDQKSEAKKESKK